MDVPKNIEYPPENCCIACLCETELLEAKTQPIIKMYEELIQTKIPVCSNPKIIVFCMKCKQILEDFYRFKQACLVSKDILEGYQGQFEQANIEFQIVVYPEFTKEKLGIDVEREDEDNKDFLKQECIPNDKETYGIPMKVKKKLTTNKRVTERKKDPHHSSNITDKINLETTSTASVRLKICDKSKKYFECDYCGKKYARKENILSHMLKFHSSMKKYKDRRDVYHICTICGDKVKYLKPHILSKHSTRDTPIVCKDCGKSFENEHRLKNHCYKQHQAKKYSCSECDYKACLQNQINYHYDRTHNIEKKYTTCSTCGKQVIKRMLLNHQRIHLNQRAFQCNICGDAFNTGVMLKKHFYVHSKVKRWNCHLCGYTTGHSQYLKSHYSKTHGYPAMTTLEIRAFCILKDPIIEQNNE